MKIQEFHLRNCCGCLKDPRQQNTKVKQSKNIDHELSETSKIIENGLLSMFLRSFEDHNENRPNELFSMVFGTIKKTLL